MTAKRKQPDDQPSAGSVDPGAGEPVILPPPDPVADDLAPAATAPTPADLAAEVPEPDAAAIVTPAPAPRRGGSWAGLLGGALAGGLVFGALQLTFDGWTPGGNAARMAGLETRLSAADAQLAALADSAQKADLAALAERLNDIESRLADLAQPPAALAEVQAGLDELRGQIASPDAATGTPAALAAVQAELDALRQQVAAIPATGDLARQLQDLQTAAAADRAAVAARVDQLQAEAEAEARATLARAAALRVRATLDSGGPIAPALADLAAAGVTVPAELAAHAAGVPTLLALQTDFPDAARAALAATADQTQPESLTGRLGAFLRNQTGMRSLTPREGDDPDAILSRAEAALADGDLAGTFTELDGLPPPAATALTPWRQRAEARVAALRALAALAPATEQE